MDEVGAKPRRQNQLKPKYVRLIGACPRSGAYCWGILVPPFAPCVKFRDRLLR